MSWLDKLERKYGKYAIGGLMTYVVGLSAAVFIIDLLFPGVNFIRKIELIPALVIKGEVWRLITYVFIPPATRPIFIVFVLYFYYTIGLSLEQEWGSFRLNVYYLLGMIGTTVAAVLTGGGTSLFLNLSLFLAFARIYPDYEILVFYILPVKVKYLAWLQWLFILLTVITAPSIKLKISAIVSVINFFIFFGKDFIVLVKNRRKVHKNRKRFKDDRPKVITIHRCAVCGRTERDNPDLEFRYCIDCNGDYEYCMEHLKNHEHVK